MRRNFIRAALAALALGATLVGAFAQAYPTRPIRFVAPFAAGSATDTVARVFADRMSVALGQPIVVENRPGAAGLLGADAVAKAPADGYTILVGTNSTNAAATALFRSVPFDMERDFEPISFLASVPLIVGVAATSPHRTLRDLVAHARANPGQVTFASASASQRVSTEMLAAMTGIRLTHVPYRAGPQAMQDMIAGRVDIFTADLAVMLPQVRGNTVRPLAVTSRQRAPQAPDVPTVDEAGGVQGYELIAFFQLMAPAGTPQPIIQRLNAAVREAAATPEVRDRLSGAAGMQVEVSSPAELRERLRAEAAKWAKAVADAGIEKE
jgi:tripartite-type tricarboxylate transporter receptor subunit TctC